MKLYYQLKDTNASVSHGGKSYRADKEGVIEVPDGDVSHFMPHGFHTTPPDFTKPPVGTVSIEAHQAVGDELTMHIQDNAELRGKVAALEAQLAEAKKK